MSEIRGQIHPEYPRLIDLLSQTALLHNPAFLTMMSQFLALQQLVNNLFLIL